MNSFMRNHLVHFYKITITGCFLILTVLVNAQNLTTAEQEKIDNLNILLKSAEEAGNRQEVAKKNNEIAFIYLQAGFQKKAIQHFTASKKINEELQNQNAVIFLNKEIGISYYLINQYDKAIEYLNLSLDLSKKVQNKKAEYDALFNLSTVYQAKKDINKAISSLERAVGRALEMNDIRKQHRCYKILRDLHRQVGNTKESEKYNDLFKALDTILTNQIIEENRRKAAEAEERTSQTLKAMDTIQGKVHEQEKRISQIEQQKQLQDLKINNLEKEKNLLEKEKQIEKERAQRVRTTRNSIIAISALMLLLLVAVYIGLVKNKRAKIALADRNIAIEEQYTQIIAQRDEIGKKNKQLQSAIEKIDIQNKQITESINYAKSIQYSMLPKTTDFEYILDDYFVYFKPRDIVSGDFYWFAKLDNEHGTHNYLIAAADCTGHGVPGAFMSMLGMKLIDEAVTKGMKKCNNILEALSDGVENSFKQKGNENRYGMDIALCIVKPEEKIVEFAGAQNPLLYIKNNEIHQIKGTKRPIGKTLFNADKPFVNHKVEYNKGDIFYIFSDGYVDQFGGEHRRKFYIKRFRKLLLDIHHKPMKEQYEILENEFIEWKGNNEQVDDIIIIGFKL